MSAPNSPYDAFFYSVSYNTHTHTLSHTHTLTHTHTYTHTHIHTHSHTSTHAHVLTLKRMHERLHRYTPPGYNAEKDGPLPCILWAYPREFKSKVGTLPVLLVLSIFLHTQTHTHIHTYAHTRTHKYIHTYTHVHTLTYTHTHTYTHTLTVPRYTRTHAHTQDAAGQMRRSPHQFSYIGSQSPMLYVSVCGDTSLGMFMCMCTCVLHKNAWVCVCSTTRISVTHRILCK